MMGSNFPKVEQDGFNIPLSEILNYLQQKGQGAWNSGVDYLKGVSEHPLSALGDIQSFGNNLPGNVAGGAVEFGRTAADKLVSGTGQALRRMGTTVEYPPSGGPIPSSISFGTHITQPTPQPKPSPAPEKPSPEVERGGGGDMFRYRSPDDLGPMDPRGYNPNEPFISPEHELGITDRGGLDESGQRHLQEVMDQEQAAMEQPGAFPRGQESAPSPTQTAPLPEDQGPSTWDRISQALTDPRTGQLLTDIRRGVQRPDSSRPYAQMGFDRQTEEIEGRRDEQNKLASQEALKREELSSRERQAQAELQSRERIASMDRDAMTQRYEQQYGKPITPELAAALGPDASAWVGRPVEEYRQWKSEQRMAASSEATSAYQMMLGMAQLDKRNKAMESLDMIMKNPFALRFLAEADPQRYQEAQAVMRANGWPSLPDPEVIPPPPGAEVAQDPQDPRRGVFGQLWDWVLEGLGIAPSNMGAGYTGPTGPTELSGMASPGAQEASLPNVAANGGAASPPGFSQGPFGGLSRADQEVIAGIFKKHQGDRESIRRELTDYANHPDDNGMKDERRVRALGEFLRGF
jgi:hypothetical protein